MLRALGEYEIGGVKTLIGFHRALLSHPCFVAGETCHGVVESDELAARAEELDGDAGRARRRRTAATVERVIAAEVDGRRVEVRLLVPEPPYRELAAAARGRVAAAGAGGGDRRGRQPDAGHGARREGRRGRRGRGGSGDLHRRGDEDGERGDGRRPPASSSSCRSPLAADRDRPGDRVPSSR